MYLKSHHWVMQPHTVYELRRELRVRESRHTSMLFDKKYFDIDSGKYSTDKLPTINSYTLADIIDDSTHKNMHYGNYTQGWYREGDEPVTSNVYDFPKFVPKKDDFEEEERIQKKQEKNRLAELARLAEEKEKQRLKEIYEQQRLEEEELYQERVRIREIEIEDQKSFIELIQAKEKELVTKEFERRQEWLRKQAEYERNCQYIEERKSSMSLKDRMCKHISKNK